MIKSVLCAVMICSVFDFASVALQVDGVRQAVCYQMQNGEVIVGALTEPIFSLSERFSMLEKIEQAIFEKTNKKVYVTFDVDLFVKISKCKNDRDAQNISQIITKRNSR